MRKSPRHARTRRLQLRGPRLPRGQRPRREDGPRQVHGPRPGSRRRHLLRWRPGRGHLPRPQQWLRPRPQQWLRPRHWRSGVLIAIGTLWSGLRRAVALPPTRERRRARLVVTLAVAAAGLVLLTRFPLDSLLSQRASMSSATRQLAAVQNSNKVLAEQARQLADPATVEGLARRDFGFVPRGQKAYQILPAATGSAPSNASALSEQVPLEAPPVVPGSSRAEALMGLAATTPATSASVKATPSAGAAPSGYWGRVVRSLEFWR